MHEMWLKSQVIFGARQTFEGKANTLSVPRGKLQSVERMVVLHVYEGEEA